jgi:hypothetical protein
VRVLAAIKPPEVAVLPVALPVPGSTPLQYQERKFALREHTPEALCDFFARQQQARVAALVEFSSLPPEQRDKQASLRIWSSMTVPFVTELLCEPADGGEPATPEEVALLTHTQRAAIIAAQEALSGLEEALGNALDLVSLLAEDQV